MEIDLLQYWYLLPTGIVIATIYSSTSISGANFWVPVYLLWVGVDLLVGFWLSLVSMLFGSVSGLVKHCREKNIHGGLVKQYLVITIPFAIIGTLLVPVLAGKSLVIFFGVMVLFYAALLFWRTFIDYKNEEHSKQHQRIHYLFGALGGFTTGLISVGLGKLILPHTIDHQDIDHHSKAIGTSLLIVFLTSLVAVIFRFNPSFISTLQDQANQIVSILLYVIPGVLIGGQLGPVLAKKLPVRQMKIYVMILLFVIGGLAIYRGITL